MASIVLLRIDLPPRRMPARSIHIRARSRYTAYTILYMLRCDARAYMYYRQQLLY